MPISALHGDNVVDRSQNMDWYEGPSLLYHLEHVHVASDRNLMDARFPVQWVTRPMSDEYHDYRGYAGEVASGVFRKGDEVVVLPSGKSTRIAGIDTIDGRARGGVPAAVGDPAARGRRGRLARRHDLPPAEPPGGDARDRGDGVLDGRRPLQPAGRYRIKHTTRTVLAKAEALRYRIDVNTLHRDEDATGLGLNDIGRLQPAPVGAALRGRVPQEPRRPAASS